MTSKLQVTIPKRIADHYKIRPGDDVEFRASGDVIRLEPPGQTEQQLSIDERLALFDAASQRQKERNKRRPLMKARDRGWTREDIYDRGRPR